MLIDVLPESREARWQLLRDWIALWYVRVKDGDGYAADAMQIAEDRLQCSLPKALCEWYSLCGRRSEIWSRQDEFLPPDRIHVYGGVVVFYLENQVITRWGIRTADLHLEDPPVVMEYEDQGNWVIENKTLSEFAIQMFLSCLKWSNKNRCYANGVGNEGAMRVIQSTFRRLPFPEWHWPRFPTRLYGGRDIVIQLDGPDEDHWVWVCTRTMSAFREFEQLLAPTGLRWESSSDEWPAGWVTVSEDH